jgi:sugar phosphate isomerase/epimerase
LQEAGLAVGVVRLGHAESANRQMQLAARLGARIVAQSASPVFFTGSQPGTATRSEFQAWLPRLGELAKAAQAEGLRLVYHNHAWDHVPLDGLTPLEIISRTFAPGEVDFEIDLAWASLAEVDPLALVRELGARVLSLHYKDVDPALGPDPHAQLVAPGAGTLAYARLVPALDRLNDAVGYVEVDQPSDGLLAARIGARTIRAARGQS